MYSGIGETQDRDFVKFARLAMTRPNPPAALAVVAEDMTHYLIEDQHAAARKENSHLLMEIAEYLTKNGGPHHALTALKAADTAYIFLEGSSAATDKRSLALIEKGYANLPDDKTKIDWLAENHEIFYERFRQKDFEPSALDAFYIKALDAVPDSSYKQLKIGKSMDGMEQFQKAMDEFKKDPVALAESAIEIAKMRAEMTLRPKQKEEPDDRIFAFIDEFKLWAGQQDIKASRGR